MIWIEIIGYAAGILTLINFFPQIIKSYKTKSIEDISFPMVLTYALSMVLWVTYAYFINSWPIMITNSIAFFMAAVQLALMFKYKKR
jgi:MtN3 and saliva related transmembrane protein